MNVIARRTLIAFWARHPETKASLQSWVERVRRAQWKTMDDVIRAYPKAKALNGERVRFEIAGGNYRMIVSCAFPQGIVFIKFLGTHAQYDRIDALTVSQF